MVERMGLLTIIVFGECILGVINGVDYYKELDSYIWICFGLGILIVFALWWIFFALVADRECKPGFLRGQLFMFLYIPTLASLGIAGATFSVVLNGIGKPGDHKIDMARYIFTVGLGIFIVSVLGLTKMLRYPDDYDVLRKKYQKLIFVCGLLLLMLCALVNNISLVYLLLIIFIILLIIVVMMTRTWFKIELKQKLNEHKNGEVVQ
jgi:low temperature requirement protein LtrA